eukprot:TRINITY_DN322_c0_g1_i1.p1 TRINITY_DN322_c0_g1~~TRINITY_DN322_c0_g1_i1.p1  ORF type:complete len:763 (-),score=244.69 TRINITY_DN322_c0_g1_i1:57-2345(-)
MSDTANNPESAPGNPNNLYSTLAVSGATIIAVTLIWNFLRNKNKYKTWFYRKNYVTNFGRDPIAPDQRAGSGVFSWIPYVIKYDMEKNVLPNYGGLDMVLYVRFLGLAFWFFFACMVFVVIALIPTYATGSNKTLPPSDINFVRGLDVISLGNLPQYSSKMWVTWVSVFVVTAFSALLVRKYWQDSFRYNMLDMQKDHMRSRTVMVHDIPTLIATDSKLGNEFSRIYDPSNVVGARMAPNAAKLRDLQQERFENANKLKITRDLIAEFPDKERPTHRPKLVPGTAKVDSEQHFDSEVKRLDAEIEAERARYNNEADVSNNTREGFVLFKLRALALASSQTNHMDRPSQMQCEIAPEPYNVYWESLPVRGIQKKLRLLISITLLVLLFIFWAVPVTFFQAISSLDALSRFPGLSFLTPVANSLPTFVTGIIQGILPSLALIIFMALLPKILGAIHFIAAPKTHAKLDNQVMKSYFAFLFLNVFLVTVIAGSLFKVIQRIVESPTTTPSLLATGISAQTSFYISYVLVNMAANFLFLTRVVPFLVNRILRKFLAKTKEEKAKKDIPPPLSVNTKIAKELILFTICLIYLSIGPLISVFATIYFGFAYMTTKFHVMYTYSPPHEGAKITPTVITVITVMTVFYQLIMVGIFSIKYFFYGIIVLICVPFTIGWYIYCKNRYERGFTHVPVSLLPATQKSDLDLNNALISYRDPATTTPAEYGANKFEIVYPEDQPIDNAARLGFTRDKMMEEGNLVHSASPTIRSD